MNRLTILLIAILFQGCISYERCVDKFCKTPTEVVEIPYQVFVPRDSIVTNVRIDSILYLMRGDTVRIEDPTSRAKISYWKGMYENTLMLRADCDSVTVTDTLRVPYPVVLEPEPPRGLKKVSDIYNKIAAWALPFLFLLTIALIKLRK